MGQCASKQGLVDSAQSSSSEAFHDGQPCCVADLVLVPHTHAHNGPALVLCTSSCRLWKPGQAEEKAHGAGQQWCLGVQSLSNMEVLKLHGEEDYLHALLACISDPPGQPTQPAGQPTSNPGRGGRDCKGTWYPNSSWSGNRFTNGGSPLSQPRPGGHEETMSSGGSALHAHGPLSSVDRAVSAPLAKLRCSGQIPAQPCNLSPVGHSLVALVSMLHSSLNQGPGNRPQHPCQMVLTAPWPTTGDQVQVSMSLEPGSRRLRVTHRVIGSSGRETANHMIHSLTDSSRSDELPVSAVAAEDLRCTTMAREAPFAMTLIGLQDGCVSAQNQLSGQYLGRHPSGWRLPQSASACPPVAPHSRLGAPCDAGGPDPPVAQGVRVLLELLLLLEEPTGSQSNADDVLQHVMLRQTWSRVAQVPQSLEAALHRLGRAEGPKTSKTSDSGPLPQPLGPLSYNGARQQFAHTRGHMYSKSDRFPSARVMLEDVSEVETVHLEHVASSPFSSWQATERNQPFCTSMPSAAGEATVPSNQGTIPPRYSMPFLGASTPGDNTAYQTWAAASSPTAASQPGNSPHHGTRRLHSLLSIISKGATNPSDEFPAVRSSNPSHLADFQVEPSSQLKLKILSSVKDLEPLDSFRMRASSEIGTNPHLRPLPRMDSRTLAMNPTLHARTSAVLDFVGCSQEYVPSPTYTPRRGGNSLDERRRSLGPPALQLHSGSPPNPSTRCPRHSSNLADSDSGRLPTGLRGDMVCGYTGPTQPQVSEARGAAAQQPAWAEVLKESHAELLIGPKCWHELILKRVVDPATGRPALLLVQRNVDERVQLEVQLGELTEAQLDMLSQIFPRYVVESLGVDGTLSVSQLAQAARRHSHATLLFMDLVGFTRMSEALSPEDVITFINNMFSTFDLLVEKHGVHKIDMLGDAMMCATGVLVPDGEGFNVVDLDPSPERHAQRMFAFAMDMIRAANQMRLPGGDRVAIRVGIHSGPCVSGLIGLRLPKWTVLGDTVNTAARMEQTCVPGKVQVSAATRALLPASEHLQPTGGVLCKGKGIMETFLWQPPTEWATETALPTSFFQFNDALICVQGSDKVPGTVQGPASALQPVDVNLGRITEAYSSLTSRTSDHSPPSTHKLLCIMGGKDRNSTLGLASKPASQPEPHATHTGMPMPIPNPAPFHVRDNVVYSSGLPSAEVGLLEDGDGREYFATDPGPLSSHQGLVSGSLPLVTLLHQARKTWASPPASDPMVANARRRRASALGPGVYGHGFEDPLSATYAFGGAWSLDLVNRSSG